MASPQGSVSQPVWCAEAGCDRPAVRLSQFCQAHLVEDLRARGIANPFEHDLAELAAVAMHFTDVLLTPATREIDERQDSYLGIALYAFVEPDTEWPLANVALQILGAHFGDTQPFAGATNYPATGYRSLVALRMLVAVPASSAVQLRPVLEELARCVVREFAGETPFKCVAEVTQELPSFEGSFE